MLQVLRLCHSFLCLNKLHTDSESDHIEQNPFNILNCYDVIVSSIIGLLTSLPVHYCTSGFNNFDR